MNDVLREALWLLADVFENSECISDRTQNLKSLLGSHEARLYYEALLERSPESAIVAEARVSDPVQTVQKFMSSDEFAANHMNTVRELFPDRRATIFLHVPKTGGHTVCEAMEKSQRFVWFLMSESVDHDGGADRLSYYGKLISFLRNSNKDFTIGGHPTASFLLNTKLKKPGDRVFTVVRDPFDLMISWINYLLTIVYNERSRNPEFRGRPDAKRVHDLIGHDWCSDPSSVSSDQIECLIENLIYSNPMCRSIGAEPTSMSALDTCGRLDIEVVPLLGIGEFCERNRLPKVEARNISMKFIDGAGIHRRAMQMIYDKIGEDLKFYSYLERTGFSRPK